MVKIKMYKINENAKDKNKEERDIFIMHYTLWKGLIL